MNNIIIKNQKAFNLLKFLGMKVWTAENETFDSYPIQFCCSGEKSIKNFKKFMSKHNIKFNILTFQVAYSLWGYDKWYDYLKDPLIDIVDDSLVIREPKKNQDVLVMNIDKENHKKFLEVFND